MKFRTTWIMLAIALAAAAYFVFVEQPRHRRQSDRTAAAGRLTQTTADEVTALVVEQPAQTLRFVREGDGWRIESPIADRADAPAVNTLLHSVLAAEIERRLPAGGAQLDEYGLDPPDIRIRVETGGESEAVSLAVGGHNLTRSHCYAVLQGGDEVLLLPAGVRRYASGDLFTFREKRVVRFETADVTRFTVASRGRTMDWSRGDGGWVSYAGGDTIRGDAAAVEAVLRQLRAMRATDIIEATRENAAAYLSPPLGAVTMWFSGPPDATTIVFGHEKDDHAYARVEGDARIDRVERGLLDIFDKTLTDLRNRNALRFRRDALARITLEAGGETVSIVGHDTDWSFINPEMGAIEPAAASVLLDRLEGLKFREIVEERLRTAGRFGL